MCCRWEWRDPDQQQLWKNDWFSSVCYQVRKLITVLTNRIKYISIYSMNHLCIFFVFLFRCNLPPLENGYEQHVGIKTNLVTANPSILIEKWEQKVDEYHCHIKMFLFSCCFTSVVYFQVWGSYVATTSIYRKSAQIRQLPAAFSRLLLCP